ncbi:unnamed protein product [Closterium sp. NIES-54]
MATPNVLTFDAEGRAVDFEVWVDDLQLFLQCDRADGLSLFDLTSGASPAPPATADSTVRSQWATRDAAARLAVRRHLPTTELTDLIKHLRTSDTRYRAALPAEFCAKNPPPHGCSPPPLLPSVASAATADLGGFESVGAVSTPGRRRRTGKGKGGKGAGGAGGGSGGGGGGSGGGGGGGGSGGGSGGVGVSSGGGGGGGGGGGSGGGGGGGGGGGSGGAGRSFAQRSGFGGGPRQQQQRSRATLSPQQLREWYAARQQGGGTGPCTYVLRTGDRAGEQCGGPHSTQRCIGRLTDAWRHQFPDATEIPRWGELFRAGVAIFDLDYDAILAAMYAVYDSVEDDSYLCVPLDLGIEAAAPGTSEAAALGASASAAPGASEFAFSGTTSAQAFHTFTLDSGASRSFFRDRTTLTPLSRPVAVSLADPSGGPVLASFSTVLPCPTAPSGTLSGLYLPSFSTNLRVTHCTCARTGRHLATFTCRPGSSLYTLTTASPPVTESGQVAASSQVVAAASRSSPEHGLPCPCLWSPPVSPSPTSGACPYLHPLRRGATVRRPSLFRVSTDRGSVADSSHGQAGRRGFSSARLGAFCRAQGIRQTLTLPASPQQNGIAERRIGMVMDVARTSMIHATAPHFLWPFAVQYAAHQLNLQLRVSLPETSPTLWWTGKVGDASAFRVWGSRAFVRDLSADKLSPRAVPCVFLGFPPDAPGWQFYHPTSRRVLSSQDVTFNESGPAPSGVSQVDAVEPVEVVVDSGAARGTQPAGAESGGSEPEGAEPGAPTASTPAPLGSEPKGAGVDAVGARGATGTGAAAGGTGAVHAGSGGATRPRPYFIPLLEQVLGLPPSTGLAPPLACPQPVQSQSQLQPASPLPVPSPYTGPTGGLAERREPASRLASPVRAARTSRRAPRLRPPAVPGTDQMALRPSIAHLRVPLPSPPESSLPVPHDPESDSLRAASPTVTRLLATVVTEPSFESTSASALVVELLEFAARSRLDYATSLVAASESESVCPPSVGGECALSTDVLEDRQEEFQCFAALPHLVSTLLAPEGDPDAPDILTPRSYAEAIEGPYSSQWQAAMDAEMASWNSTGTYVDEVPPPGANIVSGMWIFRVKRPPGSPPVFKARYVARGLSQRQGVDFFQTFSPTPKMTTLRVLLHVAAQRDYELHSLDFSTAFLQGSLHEEIWLRRPPGFTGSFPPGTQWSLRRPVYGLRQAPREWHDTLRTTLAALGFAPSTTDVSLFLRIDTSLPPFYILVYVDDLVFATADTAGLAHVKSELQKRHMCTHLGELRSYLGLQITRDRAQRTITLTQSHMVQQVLQRFDFTYSSPQATPLSTRHSLSALPSDESVKLSGLDPELVGCLMYLVTCTRPDLAYPLSILARYVAPGRHRPEHMAAAKRVLRYLCSTSGLGLVLGGRSPVVLTGHADASWLQL